LREAIPGLKRVALLSDQRVRKGLTRVNRSARTRPGPRD
jgi:hypothetical protein